MLGILQDKVAQIEANQIFADFVFCGVGCLI